MPVETPAATVRHISKLTLATLATTDIQGKLNTLGYSAFPMNDEALAIFLRNETARWAKVVNDKNVRAE